MSADSLVSYAALILADAEVDITSDKLATLVKAAGGSVDQIWTDIFAQALEGKNLKELLLSAAAAAPAAAAPAAGAEGASSEGAAAEEKAAEEEEESDDDMGFGLFD